jgi:hypothetical protein
MIPDRLSIPTKTTTVLIVVYQSRKAMVIAIQMEHATNLKMTTRHGGKFSSRD